MTAMIQFTCLIKATSSLEELNGRGSQWRMWKSFCTWMLMSVSTVRNQIRISSMTRALGQQNAVLSLTTMVDLPSAPSLAESITLWPGMGFSIFQMQLAIKRSRFTRSRTFSLLMIDMLVVIKVVRKMYV